MDHKIKQQDTFDYYFNTKTSKQEITITEKIKVILNYRNPSPKKQNKIIEEIQQAVNDFKIFADLKNIKSSEKPLEIYIFDNNEDYQHYGKEKGLGTEGGKFYSGNPPTIYVYQQGNVFNLKHEFTHYLTNINIANEAHLPTILKEGIADYIEYFSDNKFNAQANSIDLTEDEIKSKNISEFLKLKYSNDFHENAKVYKVGLALTMYLKAKKPELLKNLLHNENPEKYLELIKNENDNFKNWLNENNSDNAMQKINALEVTKGEFIASKKEIIGGEIKNVNYYTADIKSLETKEFVGNFATVEYTGYGNYIRCYNAASRDYFDIKITGDYHYLKLIKNNNNEIKLVFTNEDGTKYFTDSYEYQHKLKIINSKYDQKTFEGKITEERVNEIITQLTEINPNALTNMNLANKPLGTIFNVKKLGKGMVSALSLYDGEEKVSELLSETGFFKQIDGQQQKSFVFSNALHNLHTSYGGKVYLAVEKEEQQYKASLIDGREVLKDPYFDQPHLHKNELLSPSINHIQQKDLPSSQLNGTKIYNHKDSPLAQYATSQEQPPYTIKKGELLDNKGSSSIDDDVYEAVIYKDDKVIYNFKTTGFYITEEISDQNNNIIDGSELFIHDHGKNIRYQLPKEITYLKLIKKDDAYKLAVCDKEGTEYTDIPDEYRLIDSIFAHRYEKKDHSNNHLNIGLINFDKYPEGSLFQLKYDPNDYQIPRNENNDIVRISDSYKYSTKVKIFYNGTDIGMLSNDHHNFQGHIFFSIDYNYSFKDFLASYSPQVDIIDEVLVFEQG
ncbi:MAG: hypothetical protein RAM36_02740, partial [Arsenophonus sp.]|nr:hypothetical protein [Arsenophonus sp.]